MKSFDILCIGSVLWDIIGHTRRDMHYGADMPGLIRRIPGGVAMNIAMTFRRFDITPAILTHIGSDREGDELLTACRDLGIVTDYVYRTQDLATDSYMAIEDPNGLVAAIADAHSLERTGNAILAPLANGEIGSAGAPFEGIIALDGNLTTELLSEIAASPLFARSDLRVAPASPGKAERLKALYRHPNVTLYVNLEEAGLICDTTFGNSAEAAAGLIAHGAGRVLVTDGPRSASEATGPDVLTATPPSVKSQRVTGAGDTFLAAHVAAEREGASRSDALNFALHAAAKYVSGDSPQ